MAASDKLPPDLKEFKIIFIKSKFIDKTVHTSFNQAYGGFSINQNIIITIETWGGDANVAVKIGTTLLKHEGKVICYVPNYAFSGGTFIALCCDKIVIGNRAKLSPCNTELFFLSAKVDPDDAKDVISHVKMKDETIFEKIAAHHAISYPVSEKIFRFFFKQPHSLTFEFDKLKILGLDIISSNDLCRIETKYFENLRRFLELKFS